MIMGCVYMGPQCRANFSAGWRPGSACISWKRAITFVQLAINIFRRTAGNQKLLCRKRPVTCASQSLFWRLLFLGSPFNIPTWIKASAFFNVLVLITCRYLLMYLLVVGGVWLRLESAFMFFCWCIYMGLCSRSAYFLCVWQEPGWSIPPGCGPGRADPAPVWQVLGSTPTNRRVRPSCWANLCSRWWWWWCRQGPGLLLLLYAVMSLGLVFCYKMLAYVFHLRVFVIPIPCSNITY